MLYSATQLIHEGLLVNGWMVLLTHIILHLYLSHFYWSNETNYAMSVLCNTSKNIWTAKTPEVQRKSIPLSYIFYGMSLASVRCRRHWPSCTTLAPTMQAVRWKFSNYYQCLCQSNVMHSPHKLHIDSNRNTENIKVIKIAIENANLCRKKYVTCGLCWNMRKMWQHAKYAAILFSHKTDMPN